MDTTTNSKVIAKVTNSEHEGRPSSGVTFNVIWVPTGGRYGREGCLVNRGAPMVEFYDARHPHTEHGQFVTRYFADSLAECTGTGLCLDGGCASWSIDKHSRCLVSAAVRAEMGVA